jgi:hypothetical protein
MFTRLICYQIAVICYQIAVICYQIAVCRLPNCRLCAVAAATKLPFVDYQIAVTCYQIAG